VGDFIAVIDAVVNAVVDVVVDTILSKVCRILAIAETPNS